MTQAVEVRKSFGDKDVLRGVSIDFKPGETSLVIGGSGSGKTVLMKCMVGLLDVDAGAIMYDGRDFSVMNFQQKKEIRKEIGMVFQGGALFDSLNVQQNILFPLEMYSGMNKSERLDRVNFVLKRVKLENTNKLYPSEISGGMKKRVAIARAIALKPKYLFCDEPNSGLDPKTSLVIDNLIKEITEEYNITTIVNTHDMNSVMEIGDKVVFLFQGKKVWEGTSKEILRTDNEQLADFIFASELMKSLRR